MMSALRALLVAGVALAGFAFCTQDAQAGYPVVVGYGYAAPAYTPGYVVTARPGLLFPFRRTVITARPALIPAAPAVVAPAPYPTVTVGYAPVAPAPVYVQPAYHYAPVYYP